MCDGVRGRLRYELRATWLGGVRVLEMAERRRLDLFASRPKLGLRDVRPLRASAARPPETFKVVVFTPEDDREPVLAAAFASGAGRIGAYEQCSFSSEGPTG